MERLTTKFNGGYLFNLPPKKDENDLKTHEEYIDKVSVKLGEYEDAEEQGLLLRLPIGKDRSDLIYILARLLMHTEFGNCYLCTNPMKNVTLDGKNNGCDGNCRFDEKFDEDDLITKIIKELRTKEEAEQALVKMKEV